MVGRVVSVKMKNTAVVLVTNIKTHPLYKKSYIRTKKFFVEDLIGTKLGDLVEIVQTRPISKLKRFKVVKVVGRDITEVITEQLKEQAEEAISQVMPEEVKDVPVVKDEVLDKEDKKDKKVEKPKRKSKKEEK